MPNASGEYSVFLQESCSGRWEGAPLEREAAYGGQELLGEDEAASAGVPTVEGACCVPRALCTFSYVVSPPSITPVWSRNTCPAPHHSRNKGSIKDGI